MSDPCTENERRIMDNLAEAFNIFLKMEQTHPSHMSEFVEGIHRCQNVIIHRVVQRDHPDFFPVKGEKHE